MLDVSRFALSELTFVTEIATSAGIYRHLTSNSLISGTDIQHLTSNIWQVRAAARKVPEPNVLWAS